MMDMKIKVEIKIEEFGLRIENAEIVNEIDTEVWKELHHDRVIFYAENLKELLQIKKDIHDIMLIAQFEKECEEEAEEISENHSPIDRQADLHMYYASETI